MKMKIIRRKASGTIHVHLQVANVHQALLSFVVTPEATVEDVVSAILDRLNLKDDPKGFVLVETREGKGYCTCISCCAHKCKLDYVTLIITFHTVTFWLYSQST